MRIFTVPVEGSLLTGIAIGKTGMFPCLAAHCSKLLRPDLLLARMLLQEREQFCASGFETSLTQPPLAESLGNHLPKCAVGAPVQFADEPGERLVWRQRREHVEGEMIRVEPKRRRLAGKGRTARAREFDR